ncbi:polysaccharide lyase family 7 protein [Stigmatella aurantiaca]|uniref:Alginate lyase n=1 Tax=Stigmatella aurantiaca (strain DW4/3-1) TaxID=378806 RepID=Q094P5_STIAD|nr:polysaccharide lyase family 7 protein [Stigmatella aurantiaca]ADO75398.1 putative alginate lyase [Stigmatella aurantiaca DW4/3-1]EAU67184.1 alginate lyase [Stigmatella aurantiaca DW4/3-1]
MPRYSLPAQAPRRAARPLTFVLAAAASLLPVSALAQTKLSIPEDNISASGSDANLPVNANDGWLTTRWSADASEGEQWLQYDLGACYKVAYANLAWYNGDSRKYNLSLKTSANGTAWTTVFNGTNSGTTAALKPYNFGDRAARYVRVLSTGSNVNTWVSLSEMEIWTNGTGNCSATLDPSKAPGQNFDLSGYKLQTLDGSLEVKQVSPINSYTDKWFYTDSSTGAMTFYVPSGAGSTANSHYPRSELRGSATWRMGGTHTLTASMKVLQQPATGQIIIGQIHGEQTGGSELLKLRWTNGDILMGVKKNFGDTEQKILIKSGLSLGENIDYVIKLAGSTVTVTVNGTSKSFTYNTASWSAVDLYFKLGAYSQDSSANGTYAKVAVTALK